MFLNHIAGIIFSSLILFIFRIIDTFVHEAGHLLAGFILFPNEELDVYFGSYGKLNVRLLTFRLSRATFYIRLNPFLFLGGLTVRKNPKDDSMKKQILFILGGPLLALITSLTCLTAALMPIHDFSRIILFAFSIIFILDFIINLIPFRIKVSGPHGRVFYSDGHQILSYYRTQKNKLHSIRFWD